MVDFKIPDEEVRAMMSTRILDALSAETREAMIKEALKFLITKQNYRDDTPMQQAFNMAVQRMANQAADEVIAEVGVAEKIKNSMRQLLADVPDIYDDWDLQTAVFRAVMARAREVRSGE